MQEQQHQQAAVIAKDPFTSGLTEIAMIPIAEPNEHQIRIKTVAFAANPTDWIHIAYQQGVAGDLIGSDCSGVVEKVGSKVTGFKVGDIVSTFCHGGYCKERGTFTEYVIADPSVTLRYASVNDKVLPVGETQHGHIQTYEGAASVTLALVTSVLSMAGNLNAQPEDKGKYILIWGGATATGVIAIQVAKLGFGLRVVTVASPKHSEFLRSIGADLVFDYRDPNVNEKISQATNGEIRYVFDIIAEKTTFQAAYSAYKTATGPVKVNSLSMLDEQALTIDTSIPKNFQITIPTFAYSANGDTVRLFGGVFKADDETLARYNKFWNEVVPEILPQIQNTNLKVLKPGFQSVNEALGSLQSKSVSGEKIVFR
ncbi:hypothetical protein WICPIJ_006732 [Wickerhamomyces pijperi]|uniref:Enoyl reductase (ER) domain-containing protein n=1 Tax=Wickerhamomyces pijperi TaxID=599730 RepID=A0A9P8Q390_WICPI|nr:hypothetical protein WICPIJ_006732 [Wickerhamomyces pijperi]